MNLRTVPVTTLLCSSDYKHSHSKDANKDVFTLSSLSHRNWAVSRASWSAARSIHYISSKHIYAIRQSPICPLNLDRAAAHDNLDAFVYLDELDVLRYGLFEDPPIQSPFSRRKMSLSLCGSMVPTSIRPPSGGLSKNNVQFSKNGKDM
ncbi:hypothetical protein BB561_000950 [Smittium simulii]|uniref:Uncharacterized protein n=1 Tax=Smittium simulii TaxID=133385 RepID=A0A2T9YWV6_9FUNG|nr:hypothetical protein BB561_000950 [Smittium simulii]